MAFLQWESFEQLKEFVADLDLVFEESLEKNECLLCKTKTYSTISLKDSGTQIATVCTNSQCKAQALIAKRGIPDSVLYWICYSSPDQRQILSKAEQSRDAIKHLTLYEQLVENLNSDRYFKLRWVLYRFHNTGKFCDDDLKKLKKYGLRLEP